MKLFQHPEFRDAVVAARDHFAPLALTEQFIEKDYCVTEALRIVATQWPSQVIFKGGTSLSKGWKLIDRFSEDIDLFLNRDAFSPRLSNKGVDEQFIAIQNAVGEGFGLTLLPNLGQYKRGVNRNSYFSYTSQFPLNRTIADRIFLEMGTRSGNYPTQKVMLSSYVAQFLRETGNLLDAEDEIEFEMELLHFRRTFVEKLFAIHSKVMEIRRNERAIATYARHYYDLFCLAQQPEVRQMLQSEEYNQIKQDCDRISRQHFAGYSPPEALKFSNSEALFPTGELRQSIARSYEQQCRNLCYGSYPSWDEVVSCFEALRDRFRSF